MTKLNYLIIIICLSVSYNVNAQNRKPIRDYSLIDKSNNGYLPYQSIIHFTVEVNTVFPKSAMSFNAGDSIKTATDQGVLMLPESYSPAGKATRLVIACHGAGGGVTATGSQLESGNTSKYLVSQGYAVMDMNGLAI